MQSCRLRVYDIIKVILLYCLLNSCGSDSNCIVILPWIVPDTNTDGTPLTDLAGYELYIGTSSHRYSRKLKMPIEDKALWCREIIENTSPLKHGRKCSYAVTGLLKGTYYFAATAYNSSGKKSVLSNEVIKTALPSIN